MVSDSSFSVCIPTTKAPSNGRDQLLHSLLQWLQRQGVRLLDVYMFVQPGERRNYAKAGFACNIVEGRPGLAPQRNYIDEFFATRCGHGHHVISFDDDVLELQRASPKMQLYDWGAHPCKTLPLPDNGFLQLVQRARLECARTGSHLWGVSTSTNIMCCT